VTTIAYRNGIMAADSGGWHGDVGVTGACKLVKGRDGSLYGVTGSAAQCREFLEWARYEEAIDRRPKPKPVGEDRSSFQVLWVQNWGTIRPLIRIICHEGVEEYDMEYFAIGAGDSVAMGAMWAGASAEDAVRAAIAHGSSSFGEVKTIGH